MKNSLVRNPHPALPPKWGSRVFMNMLITTKVNVRLCDALEARLQSAEERGRLVAAVMSTVGGSDGE